MPDETIVAESSTAEAPEVNLEHFTTEQHDHWRKTGELPVPPKPADSAPADASKATESEVEQTESEAESETVEESQEAKPKRARGAEARIGELIAQNKELERRLKALEGGSREPAKTEAKADSPKTYSNYAEWRKEFKPSAWKDAYLKEYAKEHPDAAYDDAAEEATLAMADFLADVRDRFRKNEEEVSRVTKEISTKMEEAKTRYSDFEEVIRPATQTLFTDQSIPMVVKAKIDKSEVAPDLVYALGSDKQAFDKFLALSRKDPVAALDYVYEVETGVKAELAKTAPAEAQTEKEEELARDKETGKFIKPTEKKITGAPEPPKEVGGRGTVPADEVEQALESGNERAYMEAMNRRDLARRKGK